MEISPVLVNRCLEAAIYDLRLPGTRVIIESKSWTVGQYLITLMVLMMETANTKPTSRFWDGIDESIHQAFIEVIPEMTLENSLRDGINNPTTVGERHAHLRSLIEQELENLGAKESLPSHEATLLLHLLGMLQMQDNEHDQAATTWHRLLHNNHPSRPNLSALYNLATVLEQQKQYREAESLLRALIPLLQVKIAEDSPQAIGSVMRLTSCVSKQGRKAEAREILDVAR